MTEDDGVQKEFLAVMWFCVNQKKWWISYPGQMKNTWNFQIVSNPFGGTTSASRPDYVVVGIDPSFCPECQSRMLKYDVQRVSSPTLFLN